MNTFGSFPGFIIPPIIGALTNEKNGVEEWRVMFWISAVVFISATVLFWLFGSAEIQPWNDSSQVKVPTLSEEEMQINETTKKDDADNTEAEENERL
ncbi:vesicular glutamate transporter 2-like [Temnothorax curvispinosus]|uniref:Vesicular glutamate transporter 2-like n=3 Tax=Temnothorax TaxID=300110 RepID=A0A6J1R6E0_9HYME|nr:vesicular glutamate transporter 2-like [Temnothorax curvispinosus]